MLRNRRVSRVRAEPPWRHFLHSDNAALFSLPSTSSAGRPAERSLNCICALFSFSLCNRTMLPLSSHRTSRGYRVKVVSHKINWTFTVPIQSCVANPHIFLNPNQTCELLEIANRKKNSLFPLDVICVNWRPEQSFPQFPRQDFHGGAVEESCNVRVLRGEPRSQQIPFLQFRWESRHCKQITPLMQNGPEVGGITCPDV